MPVGYRAAIETALNRISGTVSRAAEPAQSSS